MVTTTSPPAHP